MHEPIDERELLAIAAEPIRRPIPAEAVTAIDDALVGRGHWPTEGDDDEPEARRGRPAQDADFGDEDELDEADARAAYEAALERTIDDARARATRRVLAAAVRGSAVGDDAPRRPFGDGLGPIDDEGGR